MDDNGQQIPAVPENPDAAILALIPGLPDIILRDTKPYMGGYLHRKIFTNRIGVENPLTKNFLSNTVVERDMATIINGEAMPVSQESQAIMVVILSLARCQMINRRSEDDYKLATVGELLSIKLPENMRDPNAEISISNLILYIMNCDSGILVDNQIMIGERIIQLPVAMTQITFGKAMTILLYMVRTLRPQYHKLLLDCHVEFYISMASRGNSTDGKLEKITRNLTEQTGQTHSFSQNRIRMYFHNYGKYISPENARGLFQHWQMLIPANALQLKLILSQASYGGLTQLVTIGRAIHDFPTFPWSGFDNAFPGEFSAFNSAIVKVAGNEYYGYARDLGEVASRHYANLAYGCKELLIRSGGNDSLKSYAGWLRTCKHHTAIIDIITKFLDEQTASIVGSIGGAGSTAVLNAQALVNEYSSLITGTSSLDLESTTEPTDNNTPRGPGPSGGEPSGQQRGIIRAHDGDGEPAAQRIRTDDSAPGTVPIILPGGQDGQM